MSVSFKLGEKTARMAKKIGISADTNTFETR